MPSPQAEQLAMLLKSIPRNPDQTIEEARQSAEALWSAAAAELEGCEYEPVDAGGVAAEWIRPSGSDPSKVLLYLHGGGYSNGSIGTHRKLAAHIASAAGRQALIIGYRLAPEHPFPAGLDDAVAAYRWLADRGMVPGDIAIGGDSAGGGLTLATALKLRDDGDTGPGALVCLSPWTDVAMTGDSLETNKDKDFMIDPSESTAGDWYIGSGDADKKHPLVSPLYADLAGLPRLLIQVGGDEVLLDDSTRLAEAAGTAGVEVSIEIFPEMQHVFQACVGNMPESDDAVAKMGAWLRG